MNYYTTVELSQKEMEIKQAESNVIELQIKIFESLRDKVKEFTTLLRKAAYQLAQCDILCGFANLAFR